MEDNDKSYLDCVHCGKCLPSCPSYQATLNEFYGPRGRTRLILAEKDPAVRPAPLNLDRAISSCLLCGRCAKICPNGVSVDRLVAAEKFSLKERKTKNPFSQDTLALKAIKSASPLILRGALRAANLPMVRAISGRFSPMPEGKPFLRNSPEIIEPEPGINSKNIVVGYFSGCVFDKIYPNVSKDTLSVLGLNGISAYIPDSQGCCGLPFISSGDEKSFKELALKNALAFQGKSLSRIVTSCASCAYSIGNLYPYYFSKEEKGYAEVMEFSSKLSNIWTLFKELQSKGFDIRKGSLPKKITGIFHIPCHLSNSRDFIPFEREEKMIGEAGFIAAKIGGLELKPLKRNYCCGNGGMFNLRHYGMSKKITGIKFEEILEAAPEIILTSCSGCMFSLSDQKGIPGCPAGGIPVKHLISLYAESLRK